MRPYLGEETEALRSCYREPPFRGLRVNPLKCGEAQIREAFPFLTRRTPFAAGSWYLPADAPKLGTHPLHHAGAFYLQEPSAGSAVTLLAPQPGERVLDLCAAPGGKSTQIAGMLGGQGLLWANEIVKSRALALLSNLERLGVRNAAVSCCHPEKLCARLSGFFDRVLVDAPCSGEGMFRREAAAAADWSPAHVAACARRQSAILESAALALRPGGVLVYSTCTFSYEENEGVICAFLQGHPEFSLEDAKEPFGRPGFGMAQARRIFPMDGGEGHFAVRLRKCGDTLREAAPAHRDAPEAGAVRALMQEIFPRPPVGAVAREGGQFWLLPEDLPAWQGLGVLRAGVLAAEARGKGRLEPSHALFQAAGAQGLRLCLDLPLDSPELAAFLHGEELEAPGGWKGYAGVAAGGVTVGFGKCSGGRMKNHYPKGLRNL